MARRGEELREHILRAAKDVFLEMGFERASMDEVAARAETSKRSLYAHFESKDKLFLAIIQLVKKLFLARLKTPGDYSEKPAEALTLFIGRYLEGLLYGPSIRMCRISMAEAARFPQGAAEHFDVVFGEANVRLAAYLKEALGLPARASTETAERLLAQLVYPRVLRTLFGLEKLAESFEDAAAAVDMKPIRKAVVELMASLERE